jgi:hypothetical protein
MECNQWNEKGLLFTANELNEKDASDYRAHLEICDFCKKELHVYEQERKTLFAPEIFEETPSAAIDKEIIRVCSNPVKSKTTTFILPAFIKNTIYAILVLAIGFGGGTYYMGVLIASKAKKQDSNIAKTEKIPQESEIVTKSVDVAANKEQVIDSSSKSEDTLIKRENEIPVKGIIPVELKDE